jgi:hypothetical protein
MGTADISAMIGLLLLVGIFVVLRKREKRGEDDSKKITVWQAVLLTAGGLALAVLLIMALPGIIDKLSGWSPI